MASGFVYPEDDRHKHRDTAELAQTSALGLFSTVISSLVSKHSITCNPFVPSLRQLCLLLGKRVIRARIQSL